jgi:tRNA (guanine10-N2)-dimethyltransferase
MRIWVELSGENPPLAEAELDAAAEAEGLSQPSTSEVDRPPDGMRTLDAPALTAGERLAARLALARRVLVPWSERGRDALVVRAACEASDGRSARFRPLRSPRGSPSAAIEALGRAYAGGGGRIRLERPDRSFWVEGATNEALRVAETLAEVDRRGYEARRMPTLPFRRPVSLPPRRARAAANLAAVRPGDRVADPFLGTGALLIEAALLGARVYGIDRDPAMVRGALRNFAHFGLDPERLEVADALEAARAWTGPPLDALLTDPPYGRASGTGGEAPEQLLRRVLPAWAARVRTGGRVVIVGPSLPPPLPDPWRLEVRVADRVHRSLTREFRVYRRASD